MSKVEQFRDEKFKQVAFIQEILGLSTDHREYRLNTLTFSSDSIFLGSGEFDLDLLDVIVELALRVRALETRVELERQSKDSHIS